MLVTTGSSKAQKEGVANIFVLCKAPLLCLYVIHKWRYQHLKLSYIYGYVYPSQALMDLSS